MLSRTLTQRETPMLSSMTAFGRLEIALETGTLSWELRAVNHRYLDLTVRMPEELRALEPAVRERVAKVVSRGKMECNLRFNKTDNSSGAALNLDAAREAVAAIGALNDLLGELSKPTDTNPTVADLLRWPGVMQQSSPDMAPVRSAALQLFDDTLSDFIATRQREGEATAQMLRDRCRAIAEIVDQVALSRPAVIERQKQKLADKLAELSAEPDTHRLEQELVYAAQRLDIDEELDRLRAHLSEMDKVLQRREPVGRRLDFLIQEFNREANTLGSKSNDVSTTQWAVDLKVLIEQMREQVQNLE